MSMVLHGHGFLLVSEYSPKQSHLSLQFPLLNLVKSELVLQPCDPSNIALLEVSFQSLDLPFELSNDLFLKHEELISFEYVRIGLLRVVQSLPVQFLLLLDSSHLPLYYSDQFKDLISELVIH